MRVDATQVEGMVGRLQTLAMKSIVALDAPDADLAKYGLDKPAVTATVGAGSARAALAIGKADGLREICTPAMCRGGWS